MENSNEELQPLFDYTRIQPAGVISLDDDDDLEEIPTIPKKRKLLDAGEKKKEQLVKLKDAKVIIINCDEDEEEEDWLPPPPKNLDNNSKSIGEDSTLKALRLKKQELASFALSADEVVRAVEESVRKDFNASFPPSPTSAMKQPVEPHQEKAKMVISIQGKNGLKQFRVCTDDKFEHIFKMYAEKSKVDVKNLVFSFDGERISPAGTPDSLEMEDNDMIEVHVKSS